MDTESSGSARIGRMDALLFAIVLEVVLLQMRIHEGSTNRRLGFRRQELEKREKIQYEKLVRDRELVKDVIRRTLIEVAEDGEFSSLQRAVEALQDRISSAKNKIADHEKLVMTEEETVNDLTTKRDQWVVKLRSADHRTAFLRDKIKDDRLNASIRLRYAELWLGARLEAQELKFQMESKPAPLPRTDHEQRVHEEICKAIELQIQEHEKAIEYWTVRYAEDIVNMNERLAEKRKQLAITTAKREELQNLYDLHEGEMRAWKDFKAERAARLAKEEHIRNSATRIQAWWRGNMVRKALGPFKYLRNIKKSPSKSKKK
ncbi:IQ domain-containing protein G-like [Phthorimaea operculella]|nr:IQ domain-containing protein G-like [Phthorimaea operculella]